MIFGKKKFDEELFEQKLCNHWNVTKEDEIEINRIIRNADREISSKHTEWSKKNFVSGVEMIDKVFPNLSGRDKLLILLFSGDLHNKMLKSRDIKK